MSKYLEIFMKVGKRLVQGGLNHSSSGNLSIREDNRIYITGTGTCLDELNDSCIVEVGLEADPELDQMASVELIVHRAIYKTNPKAMAIVHAHAPNAVVLAEDKKEIIPYDAEGAYYLPRVPILKIENPIASTVVADHICALVQNYQVVIVERHGLFSWGQDLQEACHYAVVCENMCKLNMMREVYRATQND